MNTFKVRFCARWNGLSWSNHIVNFKLGHLKLFQKNDVWPAFMLDYFLEYYETTSKLESIVFIILVR